VLACAAAQAQEPTLKQLARTSWTPRDGAPANVQALAQSADGFLLIGTASGLFRFDGVRFTPVEPPAGTAFPGSAVSALLPLPDGSLWIGYSLGGASLLSGGRLASFGEREGLPRGTVTAFARDSAGGTWAATTAGLARFERGRWRRADAASGYPGGMTTDLVVDRRGALWAAEATGVFVLPRGARRFERRAPSLAGRMGATGVPREAPDGSVWGASSPGLVRLSGPAGEPAGAGPPLRRAPDTWGLLVDRGANAWLFGAYGVVRVPLPAGSAGPGAESAPAAPRALAFSTAAGMSGNTVLALLEDREGSVWAGTEGGIDRFRAAKFTPVARPRPLHMPAVAAGRGGAVWVGSVGEPLLEVDGDRVVEHPGVPREITCAYRDPGGGVWLGGPRGVWRSDGGAFARVALPAEAVDADVQAIALGRDGTLWLSVRGAQYQGVLRRGRGGWERWGAPGGLRDQLAAILAVDSAGHTWLGYTENRLARAAGSSVRVYSAREGLDVGAVTALLVRGGRVWAGGVGGVAVLDPERGGRFRPLRVSGAPLRGISGIVQAADGDLWLNGVAGVARVPAAELRRALRDPAHRVRVERFDLRDGLAGSAPQVRPLPSAVAGTDGRLWFTSGGGVAWIDPRRIRRNVHPPPVRILSLQAGGQEYPPARRVVLPRRTTELQVAYTAPGLAAPDRVRFRYRLLGGAAGWQDAGTRREAIYTNLGPGSYRFHVVAANEDGVWNREGATLDVVIPPTFVQTRAFLALCALAAAAALWLLARWRQQRVADRLRARYDATLAERMRIARELHDTLLQGFTGVSLHVHAARRLVESRPADAARLLARAAAAADATLLDARHGVWDMRVAELESRDLPDALAAAAAGVIDERPIQLRFVVRGERRRLAHAVEVTALRIGREAVANAVEHAGPGRVEVVLEFGPRHLRLRVRDDGSGFVPEDAEAARRSGHWGIAGMRERAARMGGTLTVESVPGSTLVSLVLPVAGTE
jgi:signal transduction histidine kinase/ligand-binding sensor domain-containing protein